MPIRFVLGRAGSGKTTYCIDAILKELGEDPLGPPLILLVPDQATYQMERLLLERSGVDGFMRVFPLSFRRLAHRVFSEVGSSKLPVVDEVGKTMFLALVLRKLADQPGQLLIFHRAYKEPGLLETLSRTIAEFRRYGKGPEDIEQEHQRLVDDGQGNTPLALKLHDLALIFAEYEKSIRGQFLDSDGNLSLLAQRLDESEWIREARVWVDGFSGFTPQEYEVLEALAGVAKEVAISLCLDPKRIPETFEELNALSQFHPTEECYLQIIERLRSRTDWQPAVKLGEEDVPPRFAGSESLALVESTMFPQDGPEGYKSSSKIRLLMAVDRRTEVRAAAREILRLVRDSKYRYRDIAVILRDLEPYSDLVRSVFGEFGIPFFIDERRSMAHHPLVELIRSAVKSVVTNWSPEPVLQFLKTDLIPVDRIGIDEIENYALAFGVRGKEWISDDSWQKRALAVEDSDWTDPLEQEALTRTDCARREALRALGTFGEESAGKEKTVRDITASLHEMLVSLDVPETLRRWSLEAREAGWIGQAEEHAEAWQSVVNLLQGLVDALGDQTLPLKDYATVLEAGLSSLTLGLIPPSMDQVTVGSVERSRHPDLRAAFVLGVGEGAFPRAKAEDAVFSDAEREELHKKGFELAPSTRRELHRERYFAYIAFTRASRRLWVTYPISDDRGRELLPSVFVRRLGKMFPDPGIKPVDRNVIVETREDILTQTDLGVLFAAESRSSIDKDKDPWWAAIYNEALGHPGVRARLERILPSLVYSNQARLSNGCARDLYGQTIYAGVTSLEKFAACPFRYFGEKGLRLQERVTAELEPVNLGSLYHEVLRAFFQRTRREGLTWGEMEPEQAQFLIQEELDAVLSRLGDVLASSARNQALVYEARRALRSLSDALVFHFRRSDFEPIAAEEGFGDLTIDLGGDLHLHLRGQIDRIDAIPDTSPPVIRVVDYKTNEMALDLWKVEAGLALQLMTYLLAVRDRSSEILHRDKVVPAGGFFAPILRKFENRKTPPAEAEDRAEAMRGYRLRGAFSQAYAHRLDNALEASSRSPTHAIRVNKDSSLGYPGTTDFLPEGVLERLIQLTHTHLKNIALGILAGRAEVHPFEAGNKTACRFCSMMPVCRFEPWRNRYRSIEVKNRKIVIRSLGDTSD
jgi:ATP-dependent helicase/nuclease subunit B